MPSACSLIKHKSRRVINTNAILQVVSLKSLRETQGNTRRSLELHDDCSIGEVIFVVRGKRKSSIQGINLLNSKRGTNFRKFLKVFSVFGYFV